jgi:hypothetical protein
MCRVLEYMQKTPMVVRAVIARVERGFAAFAKIPYQDSLQKELMQLLDELDVANRRTDLKPHVRRPTRPPFMPAHTN